MRLSRVVVLYNRQKHWLHVIVALRGRILYFWVFARNRLN